jgi:hypothetical protein
VGRRAAAEALDGASPHPMAFRLAKPCPFCGSMWGRPGFIMDREAVELPTVVLCANLGCRRLLEPIPTRAPARATTSATTRATTPAAVPALDALPTPLSPKALARIKHHEAAGYTVSRRQIRALIATCEAAYHRQQLPAQPPPPGSPSPSPSPSPTLLPDPDAPS